MSKPFVAYEFVLNGNGKPYVAGTYSTEQKAVTAAKAFIRDARKDGGSCAKAQFPVLVRKVVVKEVFREEQL